jgi:hypothetical protein
MAIFRTDDLSMMHEMTTFEKMLTVMIKENPDNPIVIVAPAYDDCLARSNAIRPIQKPVEGLLVKLGLSTRTMYFNTLRDAIVIAVDDPEVLRSITRLIYPELVTKYRKSANHIQASIRLAIKKIFDEGDPMIIGELLGPDLLKGQDIPGNREFITAARENIVRTTAVIKELVRG